MVFRFMLISPPFEVTPEKAKLIKYAHKSMGVGVTFDWTLFNNWNQRKVVPQLSKAVMFNSDYVWPEAAIIKHEINQIKKLKNITFD